MLIVVQLFARARELAGVAEARLELAENATVADLRSALAERFPIHDLLAASRIAVNYDFAADSTVLRASDEVAVIPPVSGG